MKMNLNRVNLTKILAAYVEVTGQTTLIENFSEKQDYIKYW